MRCDWNDDPVCAKGFFTGDDCSEPIPPDQRESVEITILFCSTSCTQSTPQQIKTAIANKAYIPPEFLTIEIKSFSADDCCTKYLVTVADEKATPSIDVNDAKSAITTALAEDPSYKIEGPSTSAASCENSSTTAIMFGLLFCFAIFFV